MNRTFTLLLLLASMALPSLAAPEAADTVKFATHNVVLEDNPNAGQYNISLYSEDGEWKVQLNYHSEESMFGTFGNDDFGLSGTGKYYNYARNPQNDMVFYSFTDMAVTVSDEVTEYHISANCLASNNVRFLIEGSLAVLTPNDTVSSDLGYAQRIDNAFYGTYTFSAENDAYSLAYGVVGESPIGTFYTADILMPELYDKQRGEKIGVKSAIAVHEQVADTLWLTLDVLGEDLTLYHLTMFNAKHEVPIVAEENIEIEGDIALQDLTEMYGCYQLAGQNQEWGVGIAFVPSAFDSDRSEWGMDDIFLPYTTMIRLADNYVVKIHDVNVKLEVTEDQQMIFRAEITSLEGVLYHVTLKTAGRGYLGNPDQVVNIELEQMALIDYSQPGVIGLGAYMPEQCQMRVYLYANQLRGDYYTDDAMLEMCDVMIVRPEDQTFVFHDAKRINTHFETDDEGVTHVTIDMLAVDNVLYHATCSIPALRCLSDCTYSLDDAMMIALREATDEGLLYTMQFQRLPEDVDDLDVIDEGEIFSFVFAPESEGIGGEYGYSAGTLDDQTCHYIYEQGTEVRLAPVAGTLQITPLERITIEDFYHTSLYEIHFQFVAQNAAIYQGSGQNFLLCIDEEGEFVEVDEPALALINQQLNERGLEVRKVLQNGRLMIVSPINNSNNNEKILYSVDGKRIGSLR